MNGKKAPVRHHDLVVIGTGSGNSIIEWDIGLIEQRRAGGTCLDYGCVRSIPVDQNALLDVAVAS